jgi:glycerol-3-phosphate acyltransferase PlsY
VATAFTWLVFTYLLAAVPFGVLLTTLYGGDVDIRSTGSGNIGATNAARVYGWSIGGPVLLLDVGKGLLPTLGAALVFPEGGLFYQGMVATVAWLGHCYSIYLGMRGGKGVATGAGGMLALTPTTTAMAALLWGALLAVTGRSSVASLGATAGLVLLVLVRTPDLALFVLLLAAGIVYAHMQNIRRIAAGEEEAVVRPVRWGRKAVDEEDVAALLDAAPGGAGEPPPLWREEGA